MLLCREHKFWVKREECWGGTYVWFVIDRERKMKAVGPFKSERAAVERRDRMEADWDRYTRAMWETPRTPGQSGRD